MSQQRVRLLASQHSPALVPSVARGRAAGLPRGHRARVHRLQRLSRALTPQNMLMLAAVALLPWVCYLAVVLPSSYTVANWDFTWVGFDLMLGLMLAGTAWTARRAHAAWPLLASASSLLLVCDAWFDVTTSVGSDQFLSLALAGFVELPLAAVLGTTAWRSLARRVIA